MSRRGARVAPVARAVASETSSPGPLARWIAVAIAIVVPLVAYLSALHPGLPAGDSGELITAAVTGGIAHPPGYPLYTMLAGLAARLLPFGEVAWRINLFSAVTMSAAAGVLALAVARLTRSAVAGLIAACMFAFAVPVLKYALVAEVFPLHALLAALVLLALTLKPTVACVALAFLGTLTLSHHHTLVLLVVPAFVVTASRVWRSRQPWPVLRVIVAAVAGLLPLVALPIAAAGSGLRWGEPGTWHGFLTLLLRAEYGTFRLDPLEAGRTAHSAHLAAFVRSLPHTFGWLPLAAFAVGVVVLCVRHRALAGVLALFLALQALFYTRIGFPMEPAIYRGVVERFAILPLVVFAWTAGVGVAWALARVVQRSARIGLAVLVLALVGWTGASRVRADSRAGDRFTSTLGRAVLASIPPRGVLFVQGDLFHNTLAYLQRVQHLRPDVTVLDQELMTYAWYVRRVRAGSPTLLPSFTEAARIRLTDGRILEGLALPRADGRTDVLFERGHATLPTREIASVMPAAPESLYAATRAGFRRSPLLERSDDRYSGLPASRNLRWLDHLLGVRPVAFVGLKEDSYSLRYTLEPRGLVSVARPNVTSPDLAAQLEVALRIFEDVDTQVYFAPYDPVGFEFAERGRFAELAGRTALLLCMPGNAGVVVAHHAGHTRVLEFAARFEKLDPSPDAYTLRAVGMLRVFDPDFRDLARARADLERALATLPQAGDDDEARRVLDAIRSGALR